MRVNPVHPADAAAPVPTPPALRGLAVAVFVQMLPATLLTPAIRPLFAELHAGAEGPMHAFMSLNMLGAIVTTPLIARLAARGANAEQSRWLSLLAATDAVLLIMLAQAWPTAWILALRTVEGAAHLGASTLLLARAAAFRSVVGAGRAMGLAGGGLMMAIALGSGIGGLLLPLGVQAPFYLGAALAAGVALLVRPLFAQSLPEEEAGAPAPPPSLFSPDVLAPLTAAFIERFTVGLIIVTFALFATRAHGITDREVGLLYSMLLLPFALLMYPASRIGDRAPRALLLALGTLVYGAALAGLAVASRVLLPVLMVSAGAASALVYGTVLCYAASLSRGAPRGRMMALVNVAGAFGMLAGPMAGGLTIALSRGLTADPLQPYRNVFLLAGCVCALWVAAASPWLLKRLSVEGRHR